MKILKKSSFFKILISTSIFLLPYKNAIAEIDNYSSQNKRIIYEDIGNNVEDAILKAKIKVLSDSVNEFLQNEEEKNNFLKIKEEFFSQKDNFIKMIKIIGKSSTSSGRKVKSEFDVYIEQIRKYLIEKKIISDNYKILKELAYPQILVTSSDNNEYSQWAISRANSYLTSQSIKVVDENTLNSLKKEDNLIIGKQQDIALKTNSEVYISINLSLSEIGKSGNFTFFNGKVYLEAYESASLEPFIKKEYKLIDNNNKEEAYSVESDNDLSKKTVVETIMSKIMPDITKDIIFSWKESISKGRKYILKFNSINDEDLNQILSSIKELTTESEIDKNYIRIRSKSNLEEIIDIIESNFENKLKLNYSNSIQAIFISGK